MIHYFI